MNSIGIYFAYWSRSWDADYLYYIDKVSQLGFDILELSTDKLLQMNDTQLQELRKRADDKNLTLTYCIGFSPAYDLASPEAAVRKSGVEYAKRTLETIAKLGGKVFGGINYSCWPGQLGIDVDKTPYLERSADCLRQILPVAEGYDITYCVEVVNRFEQYLFNTVAEALDFIRQIGSSHLKLLLDTFHMNIEEDSIGDAIRLAADSIGHFHIGETNRREPGQGRMPWTEICAALADVRYQGAIVMEPFVKMGGQVGQDIKLYRDLSSQTEAQMDQSAAAALQFMRSAVQNAAAN